MGTKLGKFTRMEGAGFVLWKFLTIIHLHETAAYYASLHTEQAFAVVNAVFFSKK